MVTNYDSKINMLISLPGREGKIARSGIYPKTNKARIDLVKDDELYGNLFSIYFIIRCIGE